MNSETAIFREELFHNSVMFGICVVLFGAFSVRFAKRDQHISGKRALALVALPVLIQIVRELVRFSVFLDLLLPIFVAVALGYSLIALVRCQTRKYAAIAVVVAFLEVLFIPDTVVPLLGELFSGWA